MDSKPSKNISYMENYKFYNPFVKVKDKIDKTKIRLPFFRFMKSVPFFFKWKLLRLILLYIVLALILVKVFSSGLFWTSDINLKEGL